MFVSISIEHAHLILISLMALMLLRNLSFILESEMLFISGPVVVFHSETITFQAYLPSRGNMSAKWWKINDQSKEELKNDKQKYHINYQTNDKVCFEIFWADKEDSAAYQLSLGKRRSNKINVRVDGKYVHLSYSFYMITCG